MLGILKKVLGSSNERYIKKIQPRVLKIREFEKLQVSWSKSDFIKRVSELKEDIQKGRKLDDILPEAFAMVCNASKRRLNMCPFDVQLIGGMVLYDCKIAEMRTGEGKTLVATFPVFLNSLVGKGVHVITVNDYLAKRDSDWMGEIYKYLGLSVGCIVPSMDDNERQESYNADVTYGTNSELGFDYLRDNLKFSLKSMVQRPFSYALIDEVDNILIDEARTPLIISGAVESSAETYKITNNLVSKILKEDFELDEKQKSLSITDEGTQHIELLLRQSNLLKEGSLYDLNNIHLIHFVQQAIKAHHMFKKDIEYIVKDREVLLIDEFTGRMMEGRRLSDGLHQAIEAKENVPINSENQTVASITYQNLFRLYPKLSGMTGTALTEAVEFEEIYKLGVISVPTHKPMIREDFEDEIFRHSKERNIAVIKLVKKCIEKKQPILIGTVSIDKSEQLSAQLSQSGIVHNVLNARHHNREAQIIADAGCTSAVTIATNMAGRGTDIQLGGNVEMRCIKEIGSLEEQNNNLEKVERIKKEISLDKENVISAGGLCVIGTERHESRRIDNQLRGRSGRQGDPGESHFFISLEDDLMRIFGAEKMDSTLARLGLKDGEAITHPWLSKAIERAQSRVEQMHFDIRKQLIRFDDVLNDQRKVIFGLRKDIMADSKLQATVQDLLDEIPPMLVLRFINPEDSNEKWQVEELEKECHHQFAIGIPISDWIKDNQDIDDRQIQAKIRNKLASIISDKEIKYGSERMRGVERQIFLSVVDQNWRIIMQQMDQLRRGIGLRAYAQKDPLIEYKREAITIFADTLLIIKQQVLSLLCRFELTTQPKYQDVSQSNKQGLSKSMAKVSRNAPCPCGSGKKYKHCHGKFR